MASTAGKSGLSEFEALILSAVVEAAIAYALAWATRWSAGPRARRRKLAAATRSPTTIMDGGLWATSATLLAVVLTLEAAVVVVEGALIAWMAMLRLDRAMLVSLAANSGSLALGLLIER